MNLCIDIGNTRTKLAIFSNEGSLKKLLIREKFRLNKLEKILAKYTITHAIISSVRNKNGKLIRLLENKVQFVLVFSPNTPVPITNLYRTPETLGQDRLAVVTAAATLFPKSDILVIDAGTCITYDFIDAEKQYHGGSILPGVDMRFQALEHFTDRLPLVERTNLDSYIGNTTFSSIQTGVQVGLVYEVQGFIAKYRETYPDLRTLVTGGDATYFETQFKNQIFAVPNLVLMGLNQILNYNVQLANKK